MSDDTTPTTDEPTQDGQQYPLDDIRSHEVWRRGYAAGRTQDYTDPCQTCWSMVVYAWGWAAGFAELRAGEARGVALR